MNESQSFYSLTPERVLEAVESYGLRVTGRCLTLNSMENRVYEVELDLDDSPEERSDSFRVVKFYRPGRWTREQIEEEHQFLFDLAELEIPVVAPIRDIAGSSVQILRDNQTGSEIFFTLFPKCGGRSPDELSTDQLVQVGRLLGRIHAVGKTREAKHRLTLTPENFGYKNLEIIGAAESLRGQTRSHYLKVAEQLLEKMEPLFSSAELQRIHGDCHLGNLIWSKLGMTFVDFDDMVVGPPVQDLWLLAPGGDREASIQLEVLIDSYGEWHTFDKKSLELIEPLRTLRLIHFSAWLVKRWEDPAFPARFPFFGTESYWAEQIRNLNEQMQSF